jgi:hypothetical protein
VLGLLDLGPRNRRRLTGAAVGVGLIAAIAVGVVLLAGSGSSGRHKSGASGSRRLHYVPFTVHYTPGGDARYNARSKRLIFGLTKQQVRRLVGPPAKVVGNCWQYQVNAVYSDGYVDSADRLCFYSGRYSQKFVQGPGGVWKAF